MSTQKSPGGNPLALIAGPTASGKSDLAVRLALALGEAGRDAVVINADSAQVYADLRILSARPSEVEMHGVPHRLFGSWDGARACSAADWAAKARDEINAAHASGVVPILVGGTGLYIRTLLEGIAPVPEIDPQVREAVRSLDIAQLFQAVQQEDPVAAGRLQPGDRQRLSRALEVVRSTGMPLSQWQQGKEGGIADAVALAPLVLMPDRAVLNARCDARFAGMMDAGAVEEVEALLSRNLSPDLPVMRAIGVPQIAAWLGGECTRDEAIQLGQLATRQYAKRQYTWLRHQPPQDWPRFEPENIDLSIYFEILF